MDKDLRLLFTQVWIRLTALEDVLLGVEETSPKRLAVTNRETDLQQSETMLEKLSSLIQIPVPEIRMYFAEQPLYFSADSPIDPEKMQHQNLEDDDLPF